MDIMPWRWNTSLSLLQDEMNRLFEGLSPRPTGAREATFVSAPTIDVCEDEHSITVLADLPGIDRENISISVRGDLLEIRGHKQEERNEDKQHYHMHERSYGSFVRRVVLPAEVDSEKAEAKMNNGVLELRLPKAGGNDGAKQIPIH